MIYNGVQLCDYCFREKGDSKFCPHCGLSAETYRPDTRLLRAGTVLNGHYTVGKVLGQGGFGATYLAFSTIRGCAVAIKEYLPMNISYRDAGIETVRVTSDDKIDVFNKGAQRFFEEAETISRFTRNINIVSVYEFFYANNTVYYAMEYLDGVDLREHIRRRGGSLPFAEAVDVALGACNALKALHDAGILHRDIAPDNIFRCNNGALKLIDFGTAKQVVSEGEQNFSVVVKNGFAPIEQYKRNSKQGPWTDIYALGATLYYAYTGQVAAGAFDRLDTPELSFCGKEQESPTLVQVITKCLAVKSEDRYQNVSDIMRDVCRAKAEFSGSANVTAPFSPTASVPPSATSVTMPVIPSVASASPSAVTTPVSVVPPSVSKAPVGPGAVTTPVSVVPPSVSKAPVAPGAVTTPVSAIPPSAVPKSASIPPSGMPMAAPAPAPAPKPAPAPAPKPTTPAKPAPKKVNIGLIIGLAAGGVVLLLITILFIIGSVSGGRSTPSFDYEYEYGSPEDNSIYGGGDYYNAYGNISSGELDTFIDDYGKYGYRDEHGNVVISPMFDNAFDFTQDGLAVVCYNGNYGYINKEGNFVISPQFEYAFSFCEGRAIVRRNEKWGYINEDGVLVIAAIYDDVYDFVNGEARVLLNGSEFYIDMYGNYIRSYS